MITGGNCAAGLARMEKSFEAIPVSVDCHPTRDAIGIGFIDGSIAIESYECVSKDQPRKRALRSRIEDDTILCLNNIHTRRHKRSVRRVKFTPNSGDRLIVITQNRALCQWDVETGRKVRCIRESHEDPPFALHCLSDNETASGDETGIVKLWDWRVGRRPPCVATFEDAHADIVNDLTSDDDKKTLLAVSGDGTLSSINLKRRALQVQSEENHAELLSVCVTRNGTKVICGSGEGGYVEIFNWGEFGNITERMKTGHEDSVDCLVTIGQSGFVASGSSMDGTIRLHRFGRNDALGVIGQHGDEESGKSGVEALSVTNDDRYLVSCGQDHKLKFWNLAKLTRRFSKCESEDDDEQADCGRSKKQRKVRRVVMDFFDDLAEEDNTYYEESGDNDFIDEDGGHDDDISEGNGTF